MARANLGNLLSVASNQRSEETDTSVEAPVSAVEKPKKVSKTTQPSISPKATKVGERPAQAAPHWTDYERLEARLRDEQVEQLEVLTRRLNKRRSGAGERITKNTLLRVAVDLLLERQGNLQGVTEVEILAALH